MKKKFPLSIILGSTLINTHVFIDGKEIQVNSLDIKVRADELTKVEMEAYAEKIQFEGDMIANVDTIKLLMEKIHEENIEK